jgi:hypothetical protein
MMNEERLTIIPKDVWSIVHRYLNDNVFALVMQELTSVIKPSKYNYGISFINRHAINDRGFRRGYCIQLRNTDPKVIRHFTISKTSITLTETEHKIPPNY